MPAEIDHASSELAAGHGAWQTATRRAHPALGPGVLGYRGYRIERRGTRRRLELPSGAVTVVIGFGAPIRMADSSSLQPSWRARTSLCAGLQIAPTLGEHSGGLAGVEVSFTPPAAYRILGVPMRQLANCFVDLPDLLGRAADRLADRLACAPDWATRFDLLDGYLAARMAAGPEPLPAVDAAWTVLARRHGDITVPDLAAATGLTRSTLERGFAEQIGLSPKAVARVLRFQRAAGLLASGIPPARVAHLCGYYDQPHLNLDFRAMSGQSPARFREQRAGTPAIPLNDDRLRDRVTSLVMR